MFEEGIPGASEIYIICVRMSLSFNNGVVRAAAHPLPAKVKVVEGESMCVCIYVCEHQKVGCATVSVPVVDRPYRL